MKKINEWENSDQDLGSALQKLPSPKTTHTDSVDLNQKFTPAHQEYDSCNNKYETSQSQDTSRSAVSTATQKTKNSQSEFLEKPGSQLGDESESKLDPKPASTPVSTVPQTKPPPKGSLIK